MKAHSGRERGTQHLYAFARNAASAHPLILFGGAISTLYLLPSKKTQPTHPLPSYPALPHPTPRPFPPQPFPLLPFPPLPFQPSTSSSLTYHTYLPYPYAWPANHSTLPYPTLLPHPILAASKEVLIQSGLRHCQYHARSLRYPQPSSSCCALRTACLGLAVLAMASMWSFALSVCSQDS